MSSDLLHSFGRFPPSIFSGELSSRHYHPNYTIMNLDLKSKKCLRFPPVNHQLFCEAEYHTGTEADAWLDSSFTYPYANKSCRGLGMRYMNQQKYILNGECLNINRDNLLCVANSRSLPFGHRDVFEAMINPGMSLTHLCYCNIPHISIRMPNCGQNVLWMQSLTETAKIS